MPQRIDLFDSTYSPKLRVICALLVAFARLGAAAMAQDRPTAVISPSSVSSETYIAPNFCRLGTVEKGKFADLVLLNGDPLMDIHNTANISTVFASGNEFDHSTLDQMLKQAEAAAQSAVVN
jgi:hypothetical protein